MNWWVFFAKGVIEIEILTDEVRGIGVILGRFAAELNLFADLIELSAIYSKVSGLHRFKFNKKNNRFHLQPKFPQRKTLCFSSPEIPDLFRGDKFHSAKMPTTRNCFPLIARYSTPSAFFYTLEFQ